MRDVIVIGASAAGVSAAIYLARRKADFLILGSDFGGEVAVSGEIQNYPGIPNTNGIELTDKFREHLKFYDIKPEVDVTVKKVEKKNNFFEVIAVKDDKQTVWQSRAVIIATGSKPRQLNVPGEKEFRGKGVSYCTVCDGPLFKDKVVATIGGGNSANESGIMMSSIAKKVYVITKNEAMKGDQTLIDKLKSLNNVEIITLGQTKEIFGDASGFVKGLRYLDKNNQLKTLEVKGIFIHIGMIPNSQIIDGVNKNQFGEIIVDKNCRTSAEGIFAAGDVTDTPYKQIAIAVGQGVCAALSAIDYLNKFH